jgi:hypothetical protein
MIDMALIAVPLTVRLSKLTGSFWPVTRQGRTMIAESKSGTVTSGPDRLREVTLAGGHYWVHVGFLMPETVQEVIDRCVVVVLVVDEIGQETLMFTAQMRDEGYDEECTVLLPEGTYSIYSFILDSRSPTIEQARLYGIGLPMSYDDREPADTEGLYALMIDAPIDQRRGGIAIGLVVMDTAEYAGLPQTFGEYLAGVGGLLTGRWRVRDMAGDDSHGADTSIDLIQTGCELVGTATSVVTREDSKTVVQRLLSGVVDGAGRFELTSRHVRVLRGPANVHHQPDAWSGVIRDVDTLVGHHLDGATAEFVMTRQVG